MSQRDLGERHFAYEELSNRKYRPMSDSGEQAKKTPTAKNMYRKGCDGRIVKAERNTASVFFR
jgi:hypothetical protein